MNESIFLALLHNVSLLLAAALLFDIAIARKTLENSIWSQALTGFVFGIITIVIMLSPWEMHPGLVFDTRSVLLGVSGFFLGVVPTAVAMAMAAALRFHLGGDGMWVGVGVIVTSGLIGMAWRRWRIKKVLETTWGELYLLGLCIHVTMLCIMCTLPWDLARRVLGQITVPVLLIYPPGVALLGSLLVNRLKREHAVEALRESQERYRLLVEMALEGIWSMDIEHRTTYVNQAMADMLGYTPGEIIGRRFLEFIHPEDYENQEAHFLRRRAGHSGRYERRLKKKDGGDVWVLVTASPLIGDDGGFQGSLGMLTDITERMHMESALRKSATLLNSLKSTIPDLVWLKDQRGVYLSCNPVFESFFGAKEEAIIGHTDYDFVDKDLADFFLENDRKAMEAGHPLRNEELLTFASTGYQGLFETMKAPMYNTEGELVGVLGIARDITTHKQVEKELRDTAKRLSDIINFLPDATFAVDAAKKFIIWNQAMEEETGIKAEDILYQDLDVLARILYEEPHPMLVDLVIEWDAAALSMYPVFEKKGELLIAEGEIMVRGKPRWVRGVAGPMYDSEGHLLGAIHTTHDLTERKQVEQRLRQSEEKFSKVFSLSPYGIAIVRLADAIILDANAAATAVSGYERDMFIGRTYRDVNLWENPDRREEFASRIEQEGTVADFELVMRRKDGALRNVMVSGQYIDISGEACCLFMFRDITEMKAVQQAMVQSEKMMSLGGLAAGMAHEINNPLGIIFQSALGALRRLDPSVPANREEAENLGLNMEAVHELLRRRNILTYLEGIQEAGHRAMDIVQHMLNFARRSDSNFGKCDLGTVVRQAISLAEKDYDLKKKYDFRMIQVNLEIDQGLPSVPCVPSEIEQVLLNTLRNAAQAMSEAQTQGPAITVRISRDGDMAVLEVQDNGPGIPPERLKRVFEPFYTTKDVGSGTGLGLSVSYFIVTNTHKGEMAVSSEPGRGSRFTIRLPLIRPAR